MGRVFEKRKYKMFARYDKMAKGFTRIGKEIAIAIKLGGGEPAGNSRLRMARRRRMLSAIMRRTRASFIHNGTPWRLRSAVIDHAPRTDISASGRGLQHR